MTAIEFFIANPNLTLALFIVGCAGVGYLGFNVIIIIITWAFGIDIMETVKVCTPPITNDINTLNMVLLENIAELINIYKCSYEEISGETQSDLNSVVAEVWLNNRKDKYVFSGDEFVKYED